MDRGALWAAVCGVAKSWTQVIKHAQKSTVGFTLEIGQSKQSAAAAAKLLQSCPTLCDPIDGSPPGSPVPGILQARTLECVAISFSNAWKWKVKVKLLSRVRLIETPWTAAYQAPPSVGFSGKSTGVGCHCLPQSNLRVHLLSSGSFCDSHSSCVFDKIEVQFIYFCQRT